MTKTKKSRTDYTERELSQLIRRRMIQKDHGDKKKFNKKLKNKGRADKNIQY